MSAEVTEVLQQVQALESEGEVETTLADIGFTVTASDLDRNDFISVVKAVHNHPEWFTDFELRCSSPTIRLFGKSGTGVMTHSDGFEELTELDLSTDHDRAERGFNNYRDSDIERAAEFAYTLVNGLHNDDGQSVTLTGIVDKSAIEEELVSTFPSVLQGEISVFLWPDPDTLGQWIETKSITDVIDAFFAFEKLPIFVFESSVTPIFGASVVTSLEDINELGGEELADGRDKYQEAMQCARESTVWHDDLSPVPPAAVISVIDLISGFRPVLVYSVFGVFSSAVESRNGLIKFIVTSEPTTFTKQVNPHEVSQDYDSSAIEGLVSAYEIYAEHEDKAAFRDFWRLAIANTCDDLLDLPNHVDEVRDYYRDLQVDAIEKNFDDLSDAIQQIHSFMTGLTNRVSDAATQLSRQIQTLLFTLIGTIIANLFLVLRWNNVTYVPPFSLFILAVLVGFYFPLIQDRIEDLSELRKEVEKDYEMYEAEIRRFSEQIFDFEELEGRKDSYIRIAKKKEGWAQDRLDLIFRLLMTIWGGLAIWSFVGYEAVSMQTIVGIVSLVGLIGIWYYHSNNEYFDLRYMVGCVAVSLGALGVRILMVLGIGGF
ncbi:MULTISPECIES: hypothetical protein [Halobacterium]|uniref:hypothetical protein n=1 Tax=Halobacterium TaxID=2239 RepID=UPI00073EF2E4|nr:MULTISPECIES: hypothetical protein [Halobacterium]MCG1004600.1 hypothetical protein [Halobacterium noricense]